MVEMGDRLAHGEEALLQIEWTLDKVVVLVLALVGSCGAIHHDGGPSDSVQHGTRTSGGGGSTDGTLNQQDWNDICGGGSCNPTDGLPNDTPGGGLLIPSS